MKKMLVAILLLIAVVSLSACSQAETKNNTTLPSGNSTDMVKTNNNIGKSLVVYFSYSGNTQTLAETVQKSVSGDIFKLELVEPYPNNYNQLGGQVEKEQKDGYHPPIRNKLQNFHEYDTIFIGSPIWSGTYAPPIASFVAEYDLSGKTVVPFFTSDSGNIINGMTELKKIIPSNATVLDGLVVRGGSANNAQGTVNDWLSKIGLQ